jgi:hypothetical protein
MRGLLVATLMLLIPVAWSGDCEVEPHDDPNPFAPFDRRAEERKTPEAVHIADIGSISIQTAEGVLVSYLRGQGPFAKDLTTITFPRGSGYLWTERLNGEPLRIYSPVTLAIAERELFRMKDPDPTMGEILAQLTAERAELDRRMALVAWAASTSPDLSLPIDLDLHDSTLGSALAQISTKVGGLRYRVVVDATSGWRHPPIDLVVRGMGVVNAIDYIFRITDAHVLFDEDLLIVVERLLDS